MKKILIGFAAVLILIFGGLTVFVNTKSDFIIQKVSEVLEKNLNAKLEMEKLPKLSIFPSLTVSAGKSSLISPEYTVTFDNADINVSLFKLFSGTVQINSVKVDSLSLRYADTGNKTKPKAVKSDDAAPKQTKSIEEIFDLVPTEISITNSNIYYKDNTQEVRLQNINAQIKDFGMNKNSSVDFNGSLAYKDKQQDIAFDLATKLNFLFMGQSIEYDIETFKFMPAKGFPFSQPVNVTAESIMNLSPIMVEKLDGTVQSPFANLTLKSKGNKKEVEVTVSGDIFPLAIQENFSAGMSFNNLPKIMQLNAEIKNTAKTVVINKLTLNPNSGLISIKGSYDLTKQFLNANLYAENLAIQDYLPKETAKGQTANAKSTPKTHTQTAQTQTQKSGNFNFSLTADAKNISYEKLGIDTVHSVVTGRMNNKETVIDIKPLTVTKGGEPIHVAANIELAPKDLVSINLDVPNITARNWASSLMEKNPLDAQLTVKSSVSLKTADPLNTLNGTGQINGKGIKIETKFLPFITDLLQLNLKLNDRYEFSTLKAPFTIKNGLLSTTNTYIDSSAILLGANGTSHLAKQSLNLTGNAELKKQHLVFPYKVTGTYADPHVSLDLSKQLQILGKGLLNTGGSLGNDVIDGGKLLEKGLEKLFK